MKIINEVDYTYLGVENNWHVFLSKKYQDKFDYEKIYVYRAKIRHIDGTFTYLDPTLPRDEFERLNCRA